jgi:hypothetical protein
MSIHQRICAACGKEEMTGSKASECHDCYWEKRTAEKVQAERSHLLAVYGNVEGPEIGAFGKRCYTFTHTCGTRQTWTFSNLLKQFKTKSDPCSKCGGEERQKKALAGYVAKFQLDARARSDLHAYTRKVRGLSEATYRDNIDIINPQRHQRMLGNQGHHLDHITSIVECFRRGLTPEQAAVVGNLQMLPAGENMRKGRA